VAKNQKIVRQWDSDLSKNPARHAASLSDLVDVRFRLSLPDKSKNFFGNKTELIPILILYRQSCVFLPLLPE
jgi:hypothetical protein